MYSGYKNILSLILLATFLVLRIGNVHAFSHGDVDDQHCEYCDMLSQAQEHTPLLGGNAAEVRIVAIFPSQKKSDDKGYEEPLHCFVIPQRLLNRPPPAL